MTEFLFGEPGPKYILWDPLQGDPPRGPEGEFLTDGLIGRVGPDNVYLAAYPKMPEGAPALCDLEVGQTIWGVEYNLSGSKGCYALYRVS